MSNAKEFIAETEQIKRSVELINSIEDDKFPLLLQRISLKIHSTQETSFKQDEIEKLEKSLNLSNENTLQIIDLLEFIFLQSAFELVKPANLEANLLKIKMSEEKVGIIVNAWKETGKDIIERIRQTKTISYKRLINIKWRLNLQLASDVKPKQKLPNAIFEFNLNDSSNVQVEISKDE